MHVTYCNFTKRHKSLIFIVLSVFFLIANAPICKGQLHENNTVDKTDTTLTQAVSFLSQYLSEFKPGKYPNFSHYWPENDTRQYRIPDRMLFAINTEIPTYLLGKPTLLYARPIGDKVHLKTMFSTLDSNGLPVIFSITNHYVGRAENGKYYFINPMYLTTAWKNVQVRNIAYYFPPYHKFDHSKAKEMIRRIVALENEWGLHPIPIRYYFAATKMELEQYRGFDFTIAMGNRDKPTGISDGIDNVVYCGGWGENYFHEVVHLYLNPLFPGSPLTEGVAVMYGGSLGQPLQWHIKRLNQYLNFHPELSLDNPQDFYYLDNFTNPYYALLGLLCKDAYDKGGLEGLKKALTYRTLSQLFTETYHTQKGERNALLRQMIKDMAGE